MNKKYITTEGTRIVLVHYMPFDAAYGLGKTKAELLQTGYLIDDIPEPEPVEGKTPEAHYSPERGLWYEYTARPEDMAQTEGAEV